MIFGRVYPERIFAKYLRKLLQEKEENLQKSQTFKQEKLKFWMHKRNVSERNCTTVK
jgi:hypothetical protein